MIIHVLLFHRSMSVCHAPPDPDSPTAKHNVALGHDTLDTIDEPVPFELTTTAQLVRSGVR